MSELFKAAAAVDSARAALDRISHHLADRAADDGRLSTRKLNAIQPEAFALARHLAQVAAAEAMLNWGRAGADLERSIAGLFCALCCAELERWVRFNESALGVKPGSVVDEPGFVASTLSTAHVAGLGAAILARESDRAGSLGLSEDHRMVQREFARFADQRVAPLAEEIHRHDRVIPESLLKAMGELGVFGISIPEQYGGSFFDHRTMIIATEELSRASLGAGGSVITRPEICAKAILKGGTTEQKRKWLPLIASGQKIVCVAVTEPDAGSDVAAVKVTARRTEGGYVINGEKTWCTFAGRADVFILLARTGRPDEGYKGLTLFLVEKPGTKSGEGDDSSFEHRQEQGGVVAGSAIPTIGYRGMHSFSVTFDDYFVPEANRVGDEGKGFYLQMEGFAGGRIQTAARAVGVMEAAFRSAIAYVVDRKVFGQALSAFPMTRTKVAEMAARIQAGRQLAYAVGDMMDNGDGTREASLVKLMTCKDAEWVTREAMQLHGGMGYSEEYACSRYWQDARVLSIFEGAEEVLALLVIARQHLSDVLGR